MKKLSKFAQVAGIMLALTFTFSCSGGDDEGGGGGVVYGEPVTFNGETYKTVKIGSQTWALFYFSGTWDGSKTACASLGNGWHLPSKEEWTTLINHAGGTNTAGKKLKATGDCNGTDDYGFSAGCSGGYRNSYGTYRDSDIQYYWSTTVYGSSDYVALALSKSDGASFGHLTYDSQAPARCVKN